MEKYSKYVDENQETYIKRLSEAVAIPSVSAQLKHRPDVVRMGEWMEAQMNKLGIS
jgi:Cys-Gly metallodipeptidase DUG1